MVQRTGSPAARLPITTDKKGIVPNTEYRKKTLGTEWRQHELVSPALAASSIAPVSLECIH